MRPSFLLMALCAALPSAAVAADVDRVHRRSGEAPIEGRITHLSGGGVTITTELGAPHEIPWDRVRAIETRREDPQLERWLRIGTDLWRARSRLERHDAALAEEIFDRLFDDYRGQRSKTALIVAEGTLRCRIARGDHAGAVIPALEVARLRRAGVETVSYSSLEPVLDESSSLCPMLAPAWAGSHGLARLDRELADYDDGEDAVVGAIAGLYHRAVRRQLGRDPAAETITAPGHSGATFLELIVACDDPSPDRRSGACERLERSESERPAWAQAWTRFHLGRSLLGETGLGRQQRGMVSLAHLPARFAHDQPYLAGLALWHLAAALDQEGDVDRAQGLRLELSRRFPAHPVHLSAPSGIDETTQKESS